MAGDGFDRADTAPDLDPGGPLGGVCEGGLEHGSPGRDRFEALVARPARPIRQ